MTTAEKMMNVQDKRWNDSNKLFKEWHKMLSAVADEGSYWSSVGYHGRASMVNKKLKQINNYYSQKLREI